MKKLLFLFFPLLSIAISFSQTPPEENFNLFFLTFDYTSNTNTFGYSSGVNQPNFSSGLNFVSKHNFDISYSNIVTLNADTSNSKPTTEHDVMLGYSFYLSNDIIIYPSYTHMFHSKNTSPLQSAFSDIFQIDLSVYKKNYNGSVDLNYILGKKNMFYASLNNALEIPVENLIIENSLLNFQIGFSVNFSNKNYYNKLIYDDLNREGFVFWISENYPRSVLAALHSIRNNGLEETKKLTFERINEKEPDLFEDRYTITSLDFYIPVYYSFGNFTFSFTGYLNIPTYKSTFFETQTSLLFNAGISYVLSFQKEK